MRPKMTIAIRTVEIPCPTCPLVHFHSGQVENFYLLVLKQVQMNKVNTILYIVFHILINYYEFTCYIKNSVDPDQLASKNASLSGSTLFTRELISGLYCFRKIKLFKHRKV